MAKARKLDPLFTDESDDYGPIGNDTGADVYASYQEWRDADRPPQKFLTPLLRSWQIPNRDWESTDPEAVSGQLKKSAYHRLARDDAIIGLAFAQFLVDGQIDPEVRQRALWAIERQSLECVIAFRSWESPRRRKLTLGKMRTFLGSAKEGP